MLCFETGHYGFMVDVDDLATPRFGMLDDNVDYQGALEAGIDRLDSLPRADLDLSVKVGDTVYRATTCKAGVATNPERMQHARLWESGRCAQHFDLLDLRFEKPARKIIGKLAFRIVLFNQLPESGKMLPVQALQITAANVLAVLAEVGAGADTFN